MKGVRELSLLAVAVIRHIGSDDDEVEMILGRLDDNERLGLLLAIAAQAQFALSAMAQFEGVTLTKMLDDVEHIMLVIPAPDEGMN